MPDRRVGSSAAREGVEAVLAAAARWGFPGMVGNQGLDTDDIPIAASGPVPESTAERINRPIVTAGRRTSSYCPDTMREALPVVGEDSRSRPIRKTELHIALRRGLCGSKATIQTGREEKSGEIAWRESLYSPPAPRPVKRELVEEWWLSG
ncbi:MAG: hypothetical protein ACJ789_02130 [Thermomicrobiales bacterium]